MFLLSATKPASFDSRYFGPIAALPSSALRIRFGRGAEAMNVQCVMPPSMPQPFARHTPPLHAIVQTPCRERAASAALPLRAGQRGTRRVLLASARSRAPGGPEKSEGKIKGLARRGLPSQSARWIGAARHLWGVRAARELETAPALGLPRAVSHLLRLLAPEYPFPAVRSEAERRVKSGCSRAVFRASLRHVSLPPVLPYRASSHPHPVSLRSCGK